MISRESKKAPKRPATQLPLKADRAMIKANQLALRELRRANVNAASQMRFNMIIRN